MRQLELSFVKIFRNKLDFLLHVLFELLDANVFRDRCDVLLPCKRLLRQPSEYLLICIVLALLVCHVVAVRGLLVKLSERVCSLLKTVLQVLEVNVSAALAVGRILGELGLCLVLEVLSGNLVGHSKSGRA